MKKKEVLQIRKLPKHLQSLNLHLRVEAAEPVKVEVAEPVDNPKVEAAEPKVEVVEPKVEVAEPKVK